MKDFLKKLIERKKKEFEVLQRKSDASEDLAEVRAIGENLMTIKREIEEAEAQLAELEKEGEGTEGEGQQEAQRSATVGNVELRNAQVVASFGKTGNGQAAAEDEEGMAYRKAFMDFVMRKIPIPKELRQDENTTTTDASAVIPTQLVNQIIEKFDNVGMILPLITKSSYKAGIEIPKSTVKPIATWVGEGQGSDRQKKTVQDKITFSYYKLRCEISMSMEMHTLALSAFEAKFVENVSKAMIKAMEEAVINGDGAGKPKGILEETVPAGQELTTTALTFADLVKAEGVLPVEYETGTKWCMNKKMFHNVMAMVDNSGQPIARVNYGIGKSLERNILGRDVVICPYVKDDFMFMFDFSDYAMNTIYDMGIGRKQDWETEDILMKAVMSMDGKCIDTGSLVTLEITP